MKGNWVVAALGVEAVEEREVVTACVDHTVADSSLEKRGERATPRAYGYLAVQGEVERLGVVELGVMSASAAMAGTADTAVVSHRVVFRP